MPFVERMGIDTHSFAIELEVVCNVPNAELDTVAGFEFVARLKVTWPDGHGDALGAGRWHEPWHGSAVLENLKFVHDPGGGGSEDPSAGARRKCCR